MGLQTFTWTLHGEILHRDSLGSKQVIKPGQVNLMTAGKGISHSEESLPDTMLHGVQLWIALPDKVRFMEPDFAHYASVPYVLHEGLFIHLLAGNFLSQQSPSKVYSPLVGLEIYAQEDTETVLPLEPGFEYGILPLIGEIMVEGEMIDLSTLLYLGSGRQELSIKIKKGARILIIGGEPFQEEILIWWNFVGRTQAELADAVKAWNDHTQFGAVKGYQGDWLIAPQMNV
jgi:redox-sensitive bicupin YhaK (pirin superfamily)